MRPLPQQLGHIVHALLLEGREQSHLAATGVQLGDGEHLGLFAAGEFVGLGQNHQKLEAGFHARAHGFEQGFVEFGQAQARIAQQHDAGEAGTAHEVVEHHALPALLVRARDRRVAVTGQVGQHGVGHALLAEREQVDVLRAARLLRGEGQLLLLRQGVDAGGFARVGAAHESDFGDADFRQLIELSGGGEEARCVHPSHCRLCVGF